MIPANIILFTLFSVFLGCSTGSSQSGVGDDASPLLNVSDALSNSLRGTNSVHSTCVFLYRLATSNSQFEVQPMQQQCMGGVLS